MQAIIREYQALDYTACRALWDQLAQYHADIYNDPSIAGDDPGRGLDEYLGRGDCCGMWVAELDDNVVGFTGLLDVVGEEGVAEIEPVVVERSSRGEGVGTKLIEYVTKIAREKGFLFLAIRPELRNEKAFVMYVNLGFAHVGSLQLFKELAPSDRKWKSGIRIHDKELYY
jgi:GNAT superfamily N-acetyltransferase